MTSHPIASKDPLEPAVFHRYVISGVTNALKYLGPIIEEAVEYGRATFVYNAQMVKAIPGVVVAVAAYERTHQAVNDKLEGMARIADRALDKWWTPFVFSAVGTGLIMLFGWAYCGSESPTPPDGPIIQSPAAIPGVVRGALPTPTTFEFRARIAPATSTPAPRIGG